MSRRGRRALALVLTLLAAHATGCAAIVRGSTQEVRITSEPSGIEVSVDRVNRVTTPATVELLRRDDHLVEAELEGYRPQQVNIVSIVAEAGVGWFVAGALVWNVFEFISLIPGSVYGLVPEQVHLVLEPLAAEVEAPEGLPEPSVDPLAVDPAP